jgi:hypothetical protein
MKKIFVLILLSMFCSSVYCQKKKNTVLASLGIYTAELTKTNFNLYINSKSAKKDSIFIKTIDPNHLPNNCKITTFKAKNATLYLVSWTENTSVEIPKKITVTTMSYSKIYDLTTKTEVFNNLQTNTNSKEQVQLGKTLATETQERNRNEGYTLSVLSNGDIGLKNKTQEKKLVFDAGNKVFK